MHRLEQAEIRWHDAARLEAHDISWHQLSSRDRHRRASAHHRGAGGRQRLERLHGALGAIFLDEADHGIEDDDGDDGEGVDSLAEQPGDHGSGQQDDDQEVLELTQEDAEGRAPPCLGQEVGTALGEATSSFLGAQALP